MSFDLESIGLLFELQWKKKPGGNKGEVVANIGIWDTPDASLDWMTFKSYVCQNLGTVEDIYVAYEDSDGDELPIESECEFQEALKFARQRASKGQEVVLLVDKRGGPLCTSQTAEQGHKELPMPKLMTDSERDIKKKQTKATGKSTKLKSADKVRNTASHSANIMLPTSDLKSDEYSISNELSKKLGCIMKMESDKRKKAKADKDDSPPAWFKKYMQKFKSEIVAEVTTNVMYNTRQIFESGKGNTHPCCWCTDRNNSSVTATKTKKKKTSDEDTSDGTMSSDQRDHKLLKKIEKLHKRERKLEKKLDSKLEKLENKTKRRMEKKIQYKSCAEQPLEKKINSGSRKRISEIPVGTYLMDAIPLSDGTKPSVSHIKLGECYTKTWELMNNGSLPWTDKTELRLAWGTSGLEPEATTLKCPILMPGETGVIAVTFRASEFPGTFESYWHFYHMGDRFGHWLGCAVIVDSKEPEKQEVLDSESSPNDVIVNQKECNDENYINEEKKVLQVDVDKPVDLRIKYESKSSNSGAQKSSAVKDSICVRVNEDNIPPTESIKTDTRERSAEYESDTDDENLSVISGTISLSSDSEEDENFVVVPMPPCFMCDVPLDKSDAISDVTKDQLENNNIDSEIKCDFKKKLEEALIDINHSVNADCRVAEDKEKCCSKSEQEPVPLINNDTESFKEPSQHEKSEYVIPSKNEIYAVDMAGHCMPVDFAWASHSNNHINDTFVEQSGLQDHLSGNTCWSSSGAHQKEGKKEDKHKPSDGTKFSFQAHGQSNSECRTGPYMSFSSAQADGDGQSFSTLYGYSTSSSTNTTQNGFHQHESQTSSSNTSQPTSPNQHQDPFGAAVHILPETLVNGAINVASQAYTTARAVWSNIRSRPSEEFPEWHWNENSPNWSSQSDRSTTESLKILLEMGFTNKVLNVLLLQRYDNDIAKVVAELLTYKDNPGFIYNRQAQ